MDIGRDHEEASKVSQRRKKRRRLMKMRRRIEHVLNRPILEILTIVMTAAAPVVLSQAMSRSK